MVGFNWCGFNFCVWVSVRLGALSTNFKIASFTPFTLDKKGLC